MARCGILFSGVSSCLWQHVRRGDHEMPVSVAMRGMPASYPPSSDLADPRLWIGVLGPLRVVRSAVEARTLPNAERVVLGLLSLAGGSPVRRESLVEVLWSGQPPTSAAGLIQTYISRLRSVLGTVPGGGRELIPASAGSGYRLLLTMEQLDVLAFRHAVQDARSALTADDTEEAFREFERALALWRGEPLADIEALRDHPAVTALAEEQAAAVLEYADASLGAGLAGRVLPHLRALAARNPLDEALHARLLMALAGTGHQAEALAIYEELRHRLDEELGVLPGRVLREAHPNVLRQEIRVQSLTVCSAGTSGTWQPVFQLPAAAADFTGRTAESEHLISAISPRNNHPGVPVAVVSGSPGIGKTALALFSAHTIRERFPEGQLWVQLAGASPWPRDPGDVLGELLQTLGVPRNAIPDDCSERAMRYRSRLAGRRVLVVADDAAETAQILPLMPGTAGCALIVTSRCQLEGMEGARLMPLDVMTAEDAAALLIGLVGEGRAATEPRAIDELAEVCGSLPLALRIAGARLAARPAWPISAMVQRLARDRGRLQELETGNLSVRASIAASYQSLSDRSRRAFRLLALLGPTDFAGSLAGTLLGVPDAADAIDELVGHSLLTPLGTDSLGEPRYRMHDLLRDYAGERLDKEEPAVGQIEAHERLVQGWPAAACRSGRREAATRALNPTPGVSGFARHRFPGRC